MIQLEKSRKCKISLRKPWFTTKTHPGNKVLYFNIEAFEDFRDFLSVLTEKLLENNSDTFTFVGVNAVSTNHVIFNSFKNFQSGQFKNCSNLSVVRDTSDKMSLWLSNGGLTAIVGHITNRYSTSLREFQIDFIKDGKEMDAENIERAVKRLFPGVKVPLLPPVCELINKECMYECSVQDFNLKFLNIIDTISCSLG